MRRIVLGDFAAEGYWRDGELCALPSVVDRDAQHLVLATDEILFPLCNPGDTLVSRFAIDPAQKDYLASLGLHFRCNPSDLPIVPDNGARETVAQALLRHEDSKFLDMLYGSRLEPFAITPGLSMLSHELLLALDVPRIDVVKKVNSKAYSTRLRDRIGLKNPGRVAQSSAQVEQFGDQLLRDGPILLKEIFGVAGSGNVDINSRKTLSRIVKHLRKQEDRGKRTELVIEPLLDRMDDFSCQLFIKNDGVVRFGSVQKMLNKAYGYQGSIEASPRRVEQLRRAQYFEIIQKVADQLCSDGYFGPLCIDSMMLKDGSLFPVVEINARWSMGAINHQLDKGMSLSNRMSWLTQVTVACPGPVNHQRLLDILSAEKILYRGDERSGIMPLSARIFVNNGATWNKGRLYIKVISGKGRTTETLLSVFHQTLKALGWRLFSKAVGPSVGIQEKPHWELTTDSNLNTRM